MSRCKGEGMSEFKDTPLGPLPEEWPTVNLESVTTFANGLWKGEKDPLCTAKVIRNTNFNNDGTIDLSDVAELQVRVDQFNSRQLVKGDIILERSGGGPDQPVGRVVYFELDDEDFSFSNFTTRIRVHNKTAIDSKYLLYYLLHFYKQGNTNTLQARTTGIRNLNFSEYKKVPVPLPHLAEQRAIAHVLSTVRQAIEASEQVIAAARELKRSMMEHLFTYGPVSLEEAAQMRADGRLKETEVGEVPEGWGEAQVGDVFSIRLGKMLSGASRKGISPKPYIRNANVQWGYIDTTDLSEMDFSKNEMERFKLEENDILVCEGGEIGRTAIWKEQILECYYQKAIHRLRPKERNVLPEYFLFYMEVVFLVRHAPIAQGARSTIAHLPVEKLKVMPFIFPPVHEQYKIVNILNSTDAKLRVEIQRKTALEEVFRSLLEALMTGRRRVHSDLDTDARIGSLAGG